MAELVLDIRALSHGYTQGGVAVEVLRSVAFSVRRGESVALMGVSGSGKSTLLHLAALLERPQKGTIVLDGAETTKLDETARTTLRRRALGLVYQFHQLLAEFSALENVMMPLWLAKDGEADKKARRLLGRLGLAGRLHHRPNALSGGEQQRVAIARALVHEPRLLLADEPTGNLDEDTSRRVFTALLETTKTQKTAALIATHDPKLAGLCSRILTLSGSKIQ